MTDNEIIKSLECCKDPECGMCNDCLFHNRGDCMEALIANTLDLMKHQKAEIERLKKHQKAEIERLQNDLAHIGQHSLILIDSAKAEAVKEFASLIKGENGNRFMKENRDGADVFYEFDQEAFDKFVDECVEKVIGETNEK